MSTSCCLQCLQSHEYYYSLIDIMQFHPILITDLMFLLSLQFISKYKSIPNVLVGYSNDVRLLPVWLDTKSYHFNAETGNRLPKSSMVSTDDDISVGSFSVCIDIVWIAFLVLTSQLFSHPGVQISLEMWCPRTAAVDGELHADD